MTSQRQRVEPSYRRESEVPAGDVRGEGSAEFPVGPQQEGRCHHRLVRIRWFVCRLYKLLAGSACLQVVRSATYGTNGPRNESAREASS